MSKNKKEKILELKKRALDCVDKNDVEGLLACCDTADEIKAFDQGFLSRSARPSKDKTEFSAAVPALALRRSIECDDWSLLKALIERYGAENLVMADMLTPNPKKKLRDLVVRPYSGLSSKDLHLKTFESCPKYFCLWHICRPAAHITCLQNSQELFPMKTSVEFAQKNLELREFFKNCERLEQRNALSASVGDLKESKPKKKSPTPI